jgi:tryptophan synthase alpha chain
MTYYNLFYHYGLQKFAQEASKKGVDGVIVPDLPLEEAEDFKKALDDQNMALIFLIAPTSTDERIAAIAKMAKGFIYYVSRTGVTGEQKDLATDLQENIARIKKHTDLPVAVGFGISSPEQAHQVAQSADGVVMGSALVREIEKTDQMHDRIAAKFIKPFVETLS